MRCVVENCKNDSKRQTKANGITYHVIPSKPELRQAWAEALDKPGDWKPTCRNAVCSEHFNPQDFYTTPGAMRRVRAGAVPIIPQVYSTTPELEERITSKVCKMCLVISSRLFPMKTYNLEQSYERLTGLPLNKDYRLPQSLCSECAMRLYSCDVFRERSLRAHSLMMNLLQTHPKVTKEILSSISNEMPPLLNQKTFPPDHCDVTLTHKEKSDHITPKPVDDTVVKTENEDETIFVDQLTPKPEICQEFSEPSEPEVVELSDKGFDTDDSLPLRVTRKKQKIPRVKKEKKLKKEKEPKIDRRRKPFLNQDLNETLFTVTDLSVEEQLAEVLKRQDTDNYKHSVFKCTECFKGFLDQDAYTSHMVRHTNECGEYRCAICKTHFKDAHALRKHITAHHLQRFSCNHCPYVTTHRQTARLHERWHKGTKYICPHCNLVFLKFTTYMGHVRIKHPSDFVCELCGYSFVSAKGIELHKKLKHRGEDVVIPEDGPMCELCNVRFASSEAHRKHLNVSARHSGTHREHNKPTRGRGRKPLDHDDRDKTSPDADEKRRIYPSQIRKVEGPIDCEQCGMQLEDSRAYHGHFRRMHPDKNRTNYPSMKSPCMCELCGRIFQSYALLKDHRWVHTGERPFKCEQCGKSFRMKQRLVAHRRVHSAQRTSYTCNVCGKHFSTHSNRQRHMFIHTGLKPFSCEMCGKGFKHASEKRAHVTYVHLKKPWPKRARAKRPHRPGSANGASASEMDIQPAWPACDPKLADINMMEDKPIYYR